MDEATAAVDHQTDEFIQQTIHNECSNATMIVSLSAHYTLPFLKPITYPSLHNWLLWDMIQNVNFVCELLGFFIFYD